MPEMDEWFDDRIGFSEYQGAARTTAVYPEDKAVIYPALGLAGEVGEVCEKIKKVIRDKGGDFSVVREDLIKELGDVCWYLANLAFDLNIDLGEVARTNLKKLSDRKARGVIQGSGDDR